MKTILVDKSGQKWYILPESPDPGWLITLQSATSSTKRVECIHDMEDKYRCLEVVK